MQQHANALTMSQVRCLVANRIACLDPSFCSCHCTIIVLVATVVPDGSGLGFSISPSRQFKLLVCMIDHHTLSFVTSVELLSGPLVIGSRNIDWTSQHIVMKNGYIWYDACSCMQGDYLYSALHLLACQWQYLMRRPILQLAKHV